MQGNFIHPITDQVIINQVIGNLYQPLSKSLPWQGRDFGKRLSNRFHIFMVAKGGENLSIARCYDVGECAQYIRADLAQA